ncbi:MAG: PDGLE domain-containing protein [Nautiliaceae bacterium]
MKKKLFILLGVLIALLPLGLLTDAPAWGEWDSEYFKKVLGYIPQGIERLGDKFSFKVLFPDYSLPGSSDIIGYYLSAIVGALLIFVIYYLIFLAVKRKES